jgi:hypothetical protein
MVVQTWEDKVIVLKSSADLFKTFDPGEKLGITTSMGLIEDRMYLIHVS